MVPTACTNYTVWAVFFIYLITFKGGYTYRMSSVKVQLTGYR